MRYTLENSESERLHPLNGFTVRASENARRMVVFFGAPRPKDGAMRLGGTGFLVVHKEDGFGFAYLVTARHVAKKVRPNGTAVIRLNLKTGGSHDLQVDDIFWAYHRDETIDVAVTPAFIDPNEYDVAYYNMADVVRPEASPFRVQCGDPISAVGLFHWHSGANKNVPIVHTGNIALLPDPNEKILIKDRTTGKTVGVEAYLVEAQTFDGLSGAPVFQREYVSLGQLLPQHNGGPAIVPTGVQLLGVYTGAWEGEASEDFKIDRNWDTEKRVPVGLGIVVPASRILEVILNDPELKKRRDQIKKDRRENLAAVQDSILPDVSDSTDENPNHRGDFMRLVDVAARKPQQDD